MREGENEVESESNGKRVRSTIKALSTSWMVAAVGACQTDSVRNKVMNDKVWEKVSMRE